MTRRDLFIAALERKLGTPVLWGAKGPEAHDCSGLVTVCLLEVGGPDLRAPHTSQALHDATRPLPFGELPLGGDLVFHGKSANEISHVSI